MIYFKGGREITSAQYSNGRPTVAGKGKTGEGIAAHATQRTQNVKLGLASVTTAPFASCGYCPLNGNGCYAQQGPLSWIVRRMDAHVEQNGLDVIDIAKAEASAIDALDVR